MAVEKKGSQSALLDALNELSAHLGSEDLPWVLVEKIKQLMDADYATFVLQESKLINYGASTDANWEKRRPSHTVIKKVIESTEESIVQNIDETGASESQLHQKIRSCIARRIEIPGSLRGVIYCDIRSDRSIFTEKDLNKLNAISKVLLPYFHSFALYESSKELKDQRDLDLTNKRGDATGIIGVSSSAQRMKEQVREAACGSWPVLIQGDTGTGKELVAKSIHYLSERSRAPLVIVNCAAINSELVEAELFGVKRGAFTGAEFRKGKIQSAAGGTLFLDEVGELSVFTQSKLLRAIENQEVQMVGSDEIIENVDCRIICATNRNLDHLQKEGKFKLDFLERIKGYRIKLDPLKNRKEDIPYLAEYYASPKHITKEAINLLMGIEYPGNIRRLRSIVTLARDLSPSIQIEKQDVQKIVASLDEDELPTIEAETNLAEDSLKFDLYTFRPKFMRAVRDFSSSRESIGDGFKNMRQEDISAIKELQQTLLTLYDKHKKWATVARTSFGIADRREVKNFLAWIYELQLKGVLPRDRKPESK